MQNRITAVLGLALTTWYVAHCKPDATDWIWLTIWVMWVYHIAEARDDKNK